MRSLLRVGALLIMTALATSCGGDKGSSSIASPSPVPLAPTATNSLSWHPETPVPPLVRGEWVGAEAKEFRLRLDAHTYTVNIGGADAASGMVGGVGKRLAFFSASKCGLGTGWYFWTITQGRLVLKPSGTDPCEGRSVARTYIRVPSR